MSTDMENERRSSQDRRNSLELECTMPEIQPLKQRQPQFTWLVVDFACLLALGLTLLLFRLVAFPYRRGFYCDDDSINKPYKHSTVPSSVLYSVGFALAYLVISITEWYHQRNDKRFGRRCEGVPFKLGPLQLNSLAIRLCSLFVSFGFGGLSTIFVTDIGKYTVGRLRPHFLSICKAPSFVFVNCSHTYILDDVCTGNPTLLREARLSFPSGHASFSAYAVTFTILYMEAMIHFPHSKFLKFFLQLVIAQLGVLCSLSRVSDYKHHWSDVLTGLLLGVLIAMLIIDRVLHIFQKDKNVKTVSENEV